MSLLPVELGHALLLPVEAAINHALKYDPASQLQLQRLAGKLVHVRVAGSVTLAVRLLDGSIELSLSTEEPDFDNPLADVVLVGTVNDLLALARASNKASAILAGNLMIDGDTELALALGKLVDQLEIDWEAMIAPVTGGLIAHQLGQGLRGLLSWGKRTGTTLQTAAHDYLYDESGILTHPAEQEAASERVDELKLATDRLTARLDQIEQRRQQGREQPNASQQGE
ncbi:ubiquinone biosynthesis accessory factor UbiJ [Oceanobacter mangrovi]|uniref:ubiquinone biosynthesis accessory factor UbiJ n=1 Tax=Oceanobacter mangrovi TaxID=2862510 RepID=UPI001C8E48D6|nr:SCP2 sterol-binding domain-containing protein [Oceanobacter mangrovi]